MLAWLSTERWDLTFDLGRLVIPESGMALGGRLVESSLCESGTLYFSRDWKVLERWAAAGLIEEGAQTSLSAAVRYLWGTIARRGGRQNSTASIEVGIDLKLLETHC